MENILYQEFLKMRNNGMKVKGRWIRQTAQKSMNEQHPNVDLRMSKPWFQALKDRQYIITMSSTHSPEAC